VGIRRGDSKRLAIALFITIALGVAFLVTQGVEYAREQHMAQTDAYWSAFYTITGVHGAHVLVGVLMLSMNLVRTLLGHFTARRHLAVQNGAMYWHAVDLVWLVLLVVLYLAPHFR
ncbi:MAG: cytochrome c oxidase subunit 3, partial [Gemmatimonadota bacterium]|nr:cytochrome c oxidase subunit 3 [Gemmatimonadota bacterium]